MNKAARGYAATELAILIGIMGIVAAVGFPRYTALKTATHKALVRSLSNNVQASAQVAHLQWIIQKQPKTILIKERPITMHNGYPDQATIANAMLDFSGFEFVTADTANFRKIDASLPGSCMVTYSLAATDSSPTVSTVTSGC